MSLFIVLCLFSKILMRFSWVYLGILSGLWAFRIRYSFSECWPCMRVRLHDPCSVQASHYWIENVKTAKELYGQSG